MILEHIFIGRVGDIDQLCYTFDNDLVLHVEGDINWRPTEGICECTLTILSIGDKVNLENTNEIYLLSDTITKAVERYLINDWDRKTDFNDLEYDDRSFDLQREDAAE